MTGGRTSRKVAALLFGSGFCALIYQVCWLREFRLIFGASTAASAAVLAIFIGGLGLGGIWLGPRADRQSRPLLFYANLETIIALFAAASPILLLLVRSLYLAVGGTAALGLALGTTLRLILATAVLAAPTLLMGGTLPAAARAAVSEDDLARKTVAFLYGANTMGAVVGCMTANFSLLELFGTRATLWSAACINILIAVFARDLSRRLPSMDPIAADVETSVTAAEAPRGLVIFASGVVGFAFFLMEIVWYRMLSPLLGGTIFCFGLILSVALLGIGTGSFLYAVSEVRRPTLRFFAGTCLL